MNYIPDTYNYSDIDKKFIDLNEFYDYQALYKLKFEGFLSKFIEFNSIDNYLYEQDVDIPRIKDEEYNFYHKYSGIGSNFIYVRNNYHIENLTDDELSKLKIEEKLDDEFFWNTYKKVLFEEGKRGFYGIPHDETLMDSHSIIFEFAFDQKKCTNIEQLNKIKTIINNCFKKIKEDSTLRTNINASFMIYNAIPDLFYNEEEISKKLI